MNNKHLQEPSENQDFDIKYWLFKILGYWYYFVIVGGILLAAAHLYLRYTEKTYRVQASLLINDDSRSTDLSTGIFTGGGRGRSSLYDNVDTKVALLNSYDIIRETLDSLNFQVSYFREGQVKTTEIYSDTPIEIKLKPDFSQTNQKLYFDFKGSEEFNILLGSAEEAQNTYECRFGELCQGDNFSFTAYIRDSSNLINLEEPLYVRFNDLERLTVGYIGRVDAGGRQQSNRLVPGQIIDLSIGGSLIEKNVAFLNALCQVFIGHTLEEENTKANNTIAFIDSQLASITDSLTWVELALENYRASKGIIDISSKGETVLSKLTDLENQKSLIDLNQKYYDYLADYLSGIEDAGDQVVAPTAVGIADPLLSGLILELNGLKSQKVMVEVTSGEDNLMLQGIKDQMNSVKSRLAENVKNVIASNQISLNQIEERLENLRLEMNELPRNERELLTIQRKFNVNNELYTFLLRQKAESEITRAATTPNVKVLDKARGIQARFLGPVSRRIYMMSIMAAFVLVLGVLVVKFVLNETITDVSELKSHSQISIVSDVPHIRKSKKGGVMVKNSPRGRLAEAFRNLRINLDFVVPVGSEGARIIGITSAEGGEGKTFCAINLAHILAMADKKTLLIGLDLRKPRIQQELKLEQNKGLSSYLINAASFEEIVHKSVADNIDVIASGPIPPNPTELIENGRLDGLIKIAREQYDYIIVDGPPIGLVTDYIAAAKLIQTTLFVVRMNYSRFHSYKVLLDYVDKGVLKSSHLIVNDVDKGVNGKYRYGYGYYTETDGTGSIWSRLLKRRKV